MFIADYGFYLLFMACVLSAYSVAVGLLSTYLKDRVLFQSGQAAAHVVTGLTLLASFLLVYQFLNRDFTTAYVYRNSSYDLPFFYTITAFWSALEGSHFLWTVLLTIVSSIGLTFYRKENTHIMPYILASLQGVIFFMLLLAITYSDPFLLQYPFKAEGLGMNALLQNPYMAIHPPVLFSGYTALAIPFAYSIAALCYGDITAGWLQTVRRWSIFSWCALTLGIFLGGRWAYVELGWAGYWAWDPVENSSFMPWLFTTGLLHSLIVQDRLGQLKRLSIILSFLGFFFTFFGTFITRSGMISSVHSFAQSNIGPMYLGFLTLLFLFLSGMYLIKSSRILPTRQTRLWGFSRESLLLMTQFLLSTFAILIFMGTVYPILSEVLLGERFNVQAPYFNRFSPILGLGFILAVAFGNMARFQSNQLSTGPLGPLYAMMYAIPGSMLFCWYGEVFRSEGYALYTQLLGIYLVFWALVCLSMDLYHRIFPFLGRLGHWQSRNRAYIGGFIVHVGFLVAILGFLGNFRGLEKTVTMKEGDTTDLMGYRFVFDGMRQKKIDNYVLHSAYLTIWHQGQKIGRVEPSRAQYPTSKELYHEVGIFGGFWHDLYVVLSEFDTRNQEGATLQIHVNPTVRIVWISAVFLLIGGFISLSDRRRGSKSQDHIFSDVDQSLMPNSQRGTHDIKI